MDVNRFDFHDQAVSAHPVVGKRTGFADDGKSLSLGSGSPDHGTTDGLGSKEVYALNGRRPRCTAENSCVVGCRRQYANHLRHACLIRIRCKATFDEPIWPHIRLKHTDVHPDRFVRDDEAVPTGNDQHSRTSIQQHPNRRSARGVEMTVIPLNCRTKLRLINVRFLDISPPPIEQVVGQVGRQTVSHRRCHAARAT